MYTLKKVTKVIIVTDQTKKREGEKRVNRAAVIVAPTVQGTKKGIRTADTICLASPDTGKEIPRERPEKKGSRNRKRDGEKRRERAIASEYSYYVQRTRRDASFFFLRRRVFRIGRVELDD